MTTIGVHRNGSGFEKKWPEFIQARGARVKMLDLLQPDGLAQVRDCDAVMWHWHHDPDHKQSARVILSVIETELGKPVFPSVRSSWHFDDKIAQHYLFQVHGIPTAMTWLFWDEAAARAWADAATYPIVAKLSCGAGSSNVCLIRDVAAARRWMARMFSRRGVFPDPGLPPGTASWRRVFETAKRRVLPSRHFWKPEKNYALFQEFLPDNPFDTRITVIGNRAFGYRRFNRTDDFRASGSGNFDVDPAAIDPRCVRLAFESASKLGDQSIAFDFLFRGPDRTPAILEISYGYVSWMVESCPGHWDRDLTWHAGRMWPEEAHVADLLPADLLIMCGIAGIIQRGRSADELRVIAQAMADALAHRGPDDAGIYVAPTHGAALAFRRLSIIDLSAAGHQPMGNEDGTLWIVFNGEIYNFQTLRSELKQLGHVFQSMTDTEVILHGYEQWGADVVTRLNGMFAFAILDARDGSLFLARDRLGKKPLHYAVTRNGEFLFGSEIKALTASGLVDTSRTDDTAMAQFWIYGYTMGERTVYEGVRRLPPGHVAVWKQGTLETRAYWTCPMGATESSRASMDDLADELEALLIDAIRMRLIADVPLGLFLSGGIDSSLVAALSARIAGKDLRTFSVDFREAEYSEAVHAQAVAKHLGLHNTTLNVTQDLASHFEKIARQFDEPFGDSSSVPTYFLCEAARQHVTVALTGDGGDELFAGYTSYAQALRVWGDAKQRRIFSRGRSGLTRGWEFKLRHLSPGGWPVHWQRLLNEGQRARLFNSSWLTPELMKRAAELRFRSADATRGADILSRLQHLDLTTYMPDDILVKVDRMSMAHALECRCPLLDYRVVEFAAQLPFHAKIAEDGSGKHVLRHLLSRYVPEHLIDRPKQGFSIPWNRWCRGAFGDGLRKRWRRHAIRGFRRGSARTLFPARRPGDSTRQWQAYVAMFFHDRPLRVHMLIWNYWPGQEGGTEKQCRKLAWALRRSGVDVSVITHWPGLATPREEIDGATPIRRFGSVSPLVNVVQQLKKSVRNRLPSVPSRTPIESAPQFGWMVPLLWLDRFIFMLEVFFYVGRNRRNIDLIHVHESHWLASYGSWLGETLDKPVVVKEATFPVLRSLGFDVPFPRRWEARRRRPNYIAQTRAAADALAEEGVQGRILVAPNGVDIPTELADVANNHDVLYVGNLYQGATTKAFDILFDAWHLVARTSPTSRLVVVGEPTKKGIWRRYVAERPIATSVHFSGRVTDPAAFYRHAALFVLPSRREGMSNALLEAQAWGITAVVSDIPGNTAVVADGITGLVVPVNSPEALANAILELLNDPARRAMLGRAARDRMVREFGMQRLSSTVHEFYRELVST